MSKTKVALIYGIGEGDYHGRAFVGALQMAGFEVVRKAKEADIVVTHSGGCFFLPKLKLDQKYVLINPPYWPGKSLLLSITQKVVIDFIDYAKDFKISDWLYKTFVNIVHILRYSIKSLLIAHHAHRRRFYKSLRDEDTIIIRSNRDTFLAPNADKLLEQKLGRVIRLYRLPGQHDTCWRDPAPYVEIIRQLA
ncbi:MAG TPA: hypothetical protein VK978_00150 [Candidatus Saccharimonadales bacterium]|nr:hypothetical protein [Candidatus Saccharimonadales bacterium]